MPACPTTGAGGRFFAQLYTSRIRSVASRNAQDLAHAMRPARLAAPSLPREIPPETPLAPPRGEKFSPPAKNFSH